ncbi:HAD family hydrolase [Micromonospora sp. WMMD1082]|uniref:HAD family hydrolase n=1 Tax=Micromonospora sp. WMMD1082 TaxID=3016104 RepID=UPI0024168257|nr:HAD family hydrolase [Micromonospora sp. WMMD1082]MDG4793481.1 HAD family hydrolase [Micromonospora sp. WMMD1082]
MTRLLVSVDVGGTLCQIEGPTVATTLVAASPLGQDDARRVIRQQLYTRPSIDAAVIAEVCDALQLPASSFPSRIQPPQLRLMSGVVAAVRSVSRHATLVTLSNVTCLDAGTDNMHALLRPWVTKHFPSYLTGYVKPDPAAFHCVADACQSSPAHMVHIGDDWDCDIIGARTAGVTAIWVSNGRPVPEPELLNDTGVLVAADLIGASQHVTDLARWRRP